LQINWWTTILIEQREYTIIHSATVAEAWYNSSWPSSYLDVVGKIILSIVDILFITVDTLDNNINNRTEGVHNYSLNHKDGGLIWLMVALVLLDRVGKII
jgi:hypothetical protein